MTPVHAAAARSINIAAENSNIYICAGKHVVLKISFVMESAC